MSSYSWLKTSSWMSGKKTMLMTLAGTRMKRRVVRRPRWKVS
jgi:hypothetical protein